MLYREQNPHGGDNYGCPVRLDFSVNLNPLGPPPRVVEALRAAAGELDRYPDPYCRELVAAIRAYEGVPQEDILCGAGAAELLFAYVHALSPQRAAQCVPTFLEYARVVSAVGGSMTNYVLHPEDDFSPRAELFPFLTRQKPEVFFLCSPNNPTGGCLAPELLTRLVAHCAQLGTRVVLDECFLDFTHRRSMSGLLRQFPNLLIVKALTKSFALAGVRLGYVLSADHALLAAMAAQLQPWNVSVPAQRAGVAALAESDYLRRTRDAVCAARGKLRQGLETLGLRVFPSEANFLLLHAQPGLDAALLAQGIRIRSCDNEPSLGPGWYRVAVRTEEENAQLLAALAHVCGKEAAWPKTL